MLFPPVSPTTPRLKAALMPRSAAKFIQDNGGPKAFAGKVGSSSGAVRVWKHRNQFPREVWPEILKAFPAKVTLDALMKLEARQVKDEDDKPQARLHYIVERAERRQLSQADISRELEVDKSSVSRWFAGKLPAEKHLLALGILLRVDATNLFRHPDEDWLARFSRDRGAAERARIKATLEAAFPPQRATEER